MNLSDRFLVSLPERSAHRLNNSLIYIERHDGDGASGWVVNKPIDEQFSKNLRHNMKLTVSDRPIYFGGPVTPGQAYVLHTTDVNINNTQRLTNNLAMTRDKQIINMLNLENFPSQWRIVIGKCSWGPGQLESEIYGSLTNGKSIWTSIPYNEELMWTPSVGQWRSGIEHSASNMVNDLINF
jgi:putative transcriptional regulator|tara:strand:- start:557 stop:1102 length:546 start_codon:yes stop_codon:yes gene_type:complete